ncbi:hypothetical protein M0R45_008890 [Rubus argutus]|uniref:Uncharacterized protein n=1 Tax=Rubus argutus TaxID=59490 RepID=A0AAW1Y212_RUBAR
MLAGHGDGVALRERWRAVDYGMAGLLETRSERRCWATRQRQMRGLGSMRKERRGLEYGFTAVLANWALGLGFWNDGVVVRRQWRMDADWAFGITAGTRR